MIFYFVLISSLIGGQLLRFEVSNIAVMLLDLVVLLLLIRALFIKNFISSTLNNRIFKILVIYSFIAIIGLVLNITVLGFTKILLSSMYFLRFLLYVSSYFVFKKFIDEKIITRNQVLLGMFSYGFIFTILGFLQLYFYPDLRNLYYLGWDPHFGRLFSTVLDPNFAGIIIAMTFLLGLYLADLSKSFSLKAMMFFPLLFTGLLFTFSRSSYMSFAIGLGLYLILKKRFVYFFVIISIFIFSIIILPKPEGEGGKLLRTASTTARVGNWSESYKLFSRSPIIGYGFNSLGYIKFNKETVNSQIPNHSAFGVDNSFLYILLTSGFVGFVIFVLMLIRLYANVDGKNRIFYLSIVSAVLIHSFFQNTLFFPQVILFILIISASMGVDKQNVVKKK